jgi:hypothetical protein
MYMACIAVHKWNGHDFLTARLNPVRRGIIPLPDFEIGEICIYRSCFGTCQMVRAAYLM